MTASFKAVALEGLEDYGGDFVLPERGFEGRDVAEGNFVGFGEHGAETVLPESVSHERESAAGEAVKCAVAVEEPFVSGGGARKLDGGFHPLAARTAEEYLVDATSRSPA